MRISFFFENVRAAVSNLVHHKLRTFLTTLGIVFGVAAVIAMLAIGKGAEVEAIEQIQAFGINNIRIRAVKVERDEQRKAILRLSKGLSYEDALYIEELLPYVTAIAPQNLLDKEFKVGPVKPKGNLVGTTPGYEQVVGLQVKRGRFLVPEDLSSYRKVCVIGPSIAQEAFLTEDPVGKTMTIGGLRFKVVGVMGDRAQTKEMVKIKTRDISQDVYVPITTSLDRFTMLRDEIQGVNQTDYNVVDEIALQVDKPERLSEAKVTLKKIFSRRHKQTKDCEVIVPDELLAQSQKTQKLFNFVMACIAGLSLLVGGIGIMNIMLATVTERTPEIGIRRAIGASARDILFYFLIESVLICFAGGIMGIAVGLGLGTLVTQVARWRTVFAPESLILAFGVATSVGIFFGLYPAYLAAKLDPIKALRHE
jgi:putative ABC transport system permease protein